MTKNRLIIDVDGTAYSLHSSLSEACERLFGRAVEPEEITDWYALRRIFGKDYFEAYRIALDPCRVMGRTPFPGFVYAMERLHAAGLTIHFLTHNEDPEAIEPALREWFDHMLPHVPYELEATTARKCKVKRALELGDVALLIDDKPSTIDKALEAGVPIASKRHPYHKKYEDDPRVFLFDDWGKATSLIEALTIRHSAV